MDYKKISKQLKKFKSLYDTLLESGQDPAGIEKDLLLSYLRDIYEGVSKADVEALDATSESITASSNSFVSSSITPPPVQPQIVKEPVPVQVAPVAEIAPPSPDPAVPVNQAPPELSPIQSQPEAIDLSPVKELFAVQAVTQLSDRLNTLPISDINKGMGINEKIFTINELFNADQKLFEKVVDKLNSLNSFAEAEQYLVAGIATENDWAEESKRKKAAKFIQLLRRRYN